MAVEQDWSLNSVLKEPQEISFNPDYVFSEQVIQARAFTIESADVDERTVTFVSIEAGLVSNKSQFRDTEAMAVIAPDDWEQQVSDTMEDASLAFVEYFPGEWEDTVNTSQFSYAAARAKSWGDQMIGPVYQAVADLAMHKGISLACADVANKTAFGIYEFGFPNIVPQTLGISAYGAQISTSERYLPQAADARRMGTVAGMLQTIHKYPEASRFMYIAAPAHVRRVQKYLTQQLTVMDRIRKGLYASTMIGLDTCTRIYEPTDEGWSCISSERYWNPENRLTMTAVGLVAGVALVRKARHSS